MFYTINNLKKREIILNANSLEFYSDDDYDDIDILFPLDEN